MKQFSTFSLEEIGDLLSILAEKSDSVYWLSSPNFEKIQYISPAFEKIWGRSRDELYRDPELWITYLHPDDSRGHHPIHATRGKIAEFGPDARYEESYRIVRPDGEVRWIIDRGFLIYDNEGECCGITGVAVDVTREKKLEILEKEKAIAEATISRLKAVAGSIAHQITNPLTAVNIAYDYIHQRFEKLFHCYHKAVQTGVVQPSITQDEIEKMESFSSQISHRIKETGFIIGHHLVNINENRWHTPIDKLLLKPQLISEIIDDALEIYPFLYQHQRELVHRQKGPDFRVLGEKDLLTHVVLNLIDNALKSIEAVGKGQIFIWLETGTDYNFLHIKDTGEGLARKGRGEIFKPFISLREGSTGLGLYFCRSVMHAYQGEISCLGEKGEYAQFTLKFPRQKRQLR